MYSVSKRLIPANHSPEIDWRWCAEKCIQAAHPGQPQLCGEPRFGLHKANGARTAQPDTTTWRFSPRLQSALLVWLISPQIRSLDRPYPIPNLDSRSSACPIPAADGILRSWRGQSCRQVLLDEPQNHPISNQEPQFSQHPRPVCRFGQNRHGASRLCPPRRPTGSPPPFTPGRVA